MAGVAAAVVALVSEGVAEHTPVSDVGGGIVTATVRAPTGTIVGLISNPHFGAEPAVP